MPRFIPRPRGLYVKDVKVERIGPTSVKFTCPKGHNSTTDFSKVRISKRIGSLALDRLVPYWQDRITYTCKSCQKKLNK